VEEGCGVVDENEDERFGGEEEEEEGKCSLLFTKEDLLRVVVGVEF
jgi:hypothetical protein